MNGTRDIVSELGFFMPFEAPPIDINRKGAKVLALSCIDPRFNERLAYYLISEKEVHADYDLVTLPGASLGVLQKKYPCWKQMFHETLDIAIALHGIKEVWCFDHLDCGMYKETLGLETDLEPAIHMTHLSMLRSELAAVYPTLGFKGFIMMTDGRIVQTT